MGAWGLAGISSRSMVKPRPYTPVTVWLLLALSLVLDLAAAAGQAAKVPEGEVMLALGTGLGVLLATAAMLGVVRRQRAGR